MILDRERLTELDAMWAAVCGADAQADGPGTKLLLRSVLDALPDILESALYCAGRASAELQQERAEKINVRLHALLDCWPPCETACTHVLHGEWTALGAANVLGRHSS